MYEVNVSVACEFEHDWWDYYDSVFFMKFDTEEQAWRICYEIAGQCMKHSKMVEHVVLACWGDCITQLEYEYSITRRDDERPHDMIKEVFFDNECFWYKED